VVWEGRSREAPPYPDPRAEIDKRYLDQPYYIAPNGKVGAEAFVVIRDAMQDEKRVALARIVMAHRDT